MRLCRVDPRVSLTTRHKRRVWTSLAAVAAAVGIALRLRELLSRRSLWLDEAMLANNVVSRSWRGLTEPLSDSQVAPVGFLWAERAVVRGFGNNEYALRILPFAAGIGALGLTYLVARRLVSARASAAAVLLCALCPPLVRYSTEVKQYSGDVFVALLVTWLALRAIDDATEDADEDADGRRWLAGWAVAGAAGVWLSHFAVFVVAGTGVVMLARPPCRRLAVVAAAALAALSFAAVYLLTIAELSDNEVMADYWAAGFPPVGGSFGGLVGWLAGRTGALFAETAGFRPALVAGLASALGVAALVVGAGRTRRRLALLVAPLGIVSAAAIFRVYPIDGRLLLAAVPVLAVLVVAGLDGALMMRGLAAAAMVVLVAGWAAPTIDVVRSPTTIAEIRPVLEMVARSAEPGDHVYVHDVTEPPARYYGPGLGLRPERRLMWMPAGPLCAGDVERQAVAPSGGSGRIWVVYAYRLSIRPADEADRVFRRLDALAQRRATIVRPGASAALFDFRAPPTAPTVTAPSGELGCLGAIPLAP